jgi:LysM repeat protein
LAIRRRRVVGLTLAAAAVCAALGVVPELNGLWWAAIVLGLVAAGYTVLVARIGHVHARRELAMSFDPDGGAGRFDWSELERELLPAAGASDEDPGVHPDTAVERGTGALVRFLAAYALGWVLTPVVSLIWLVHGEPSDLERHPVIRRIVGLQQYGRSRSLRLLTVGAAATVGVTALGGATSGVFASPGVPVAAQAASTYTVRRGDTLSAVAARYGSTVAALAAWNRLANPNLIFVGQVLNIRPGAPTPGAPTAAAPPAAPVGAHPPTPAPSTYTVRRGDTLSAIAARYGSTVAALAAWNRLANPNLLYPGQVLTLYGLGGPTTPQSGQSGSGPVTPRPLGASLPLPSQYLRGGTVDQGVDYGAPGGTPLFAMGPGVIVREGMSGFGPNAPVLQITGGPLAGKAVYYGHAGSDLVSVGAQVAAGQQISIVGYGIVGISTGPHLEIGFYPPGPMGAGRAMLNYINAEVGYSTGS